MSKPSATPVAASIPFDSDEDTFGVTLSTPFTANNLQDAVIEARDAGGSGTFDVMLNDSFIILFNDNLERIIV